MYHGLSGLIHRTFCFCEARKELQDIGEACAVFQSQIARIEVDGDAEEKERDFLNSHNPHNLI